MARFRFLPAAQSELLEQIGYYRSIRPELGARFHQAVDEAIRLAATDPGHGAPRTKNTRRRLVAGFPFGVIYAERAGHILVIAIADGRRKPEYWVSRVIDDSLQN
jgi:plasmid stabilization system protein ParE